MRSLRTRITFLTVCAITLAIAIVTLLSAFFIRNSESVKSDQILLLLCETGERNLDYYFDSVQNSVGKSHPMWKKTSTGWRPRSWSSM